MVYQQLTIELPDVDKKLTKAAVEKAFVTYRMFKRVPLSRLAAGPSTKVTASYPTSDADMIKGQNNVRTAGEVISEVAERLRLIESIETVVDNLPYNEMTILKRTMMKDEDDCDADVNVMESLHLGKTKYYEVKWRAMLRVAFALRIEVMKERK